VPPERARRRPLDHAHPLRSHAACAGAPALNIPLLPAAFICKAELGPATSTRGDRFSLQLTPSEMRVLMAIVDVGGVAEIAPCSAFPRPPSDHLQHVFEKTGTQRQADLVKLVAGYMSPIAGS